MTEEAIHKIIIEMQAIESLGTQISKRCYRLRVELEGFLSPAPPKRGRKKHEISDAEKAAIRNRLYRNLKIQAI